MQRRVPLARGDRRVSPAHRPDSLTINVSASVVLPHRCRYGWSMSARRKWDHRPRVDMSETLGDRFKPWHDDGARGAGSFLAIEAARLELAKDPAALSAVYRILVTEIERAYLATSDATGERKGGSVTFVQRFSGSLGLHVHFHLVACDGVFVRDDPESMPRFVAAPAPSRETLANVVERIHDRTRRWLRRHGYLDERPAEERSNEPPAESAVDACLRIAAGQGTLAKRLDPPSDGGAGGHEDGEHDAFAARKSKWVAAYEGFDLHAGVTVANGHRTFLERLCRYGARPAFALERLSPRPDGTFAYRMKYPLRGKTHRILTPMELMARLAGIVPPPRYPLVRFAGVLAPASKWRALVVPTHPPHRRCCAAHERERQQRRSADTAAAATSATATSDRTATETADDVIVPPKASLPALSDASVLATRAALPSPASTRIPWADLLRHGFEFDALACRCGGRMRIVAAVTDPSEVERLLRHLGERTGAPRLTRVHQPVPIELDELPPDDWV